MVSDLQRPMVGGRNHYLQDRQAQHFSFAASLCKLSFPYHCSPGCNAIFLETHLFVLRINP